jgi:hypothetical protein
VKTPLTGVFTQWYAALRPAAAGMPGVRQGLLSLALLCLRAVRAALRALPEPPPDLMYELL